MSKNNWGWMSETIEAPGITPVAEFRRMALGAGGTLSLGYNCQVRDTSWRKAKIDKVQ